MSDDNNIALDEMKEIIDDFLIEADELISSLDTNLVALESAPKDLDLLNTIFRAAHTIKGTSSFLGFEQVTNLTHKMEDILNRLRKAELTVTPEIMDLLLESLDILKVLLENVRNHSDEQLDLSEIIVRLAAANEGQAIPAGETGRAIAQGTVAAETSTEPKAETRKTGSSAKGGEGQTIRVDVNRLDSLMNLTGELVLSRNSLQQVVNTINKKDETVSSREQLNRSAAALSFITTELQFAVMKLRMQPIGKVFSKFPRLVRDLTRDLGKDIELILKGETTELDKSVIEEIGDPLVHIVRNSCDHGIESPEERRSSGKPATGHVIMSASQEGSHIVIKVSDDGRGLDVEAIRAKAVERGMVTEAEAARLSERDVFRFIFAAGLSTAKKVSGVSGRGVGMDVVRTNIEKLNGLIELESTFGIGTTIVIKLPLTLASMQGLLIESDDEVYILPLSSVYETVRSESAAVYYINQRPVMRLRDEIIPLINLGQVLRENVAGFTLTEKPYVVVVGLADRKLGIMIDRFLGQEEAVIKSLGNFLGNTDGVAGATILGDGRIRLIVDLIGLFNVAGRLH
ncbi:MAG: chemotaxis protein CheA [candidate division Zixibacteria bacterium]|nr:chemotaxis protein CheA [candidate division Zixibacteria bacterium]